MGDDISQYRARIGTFKSFRVCQTSKVSYCSRDVTSMDISDVILCVFGVIEFIRILLVISGVEPNPGPTSPRRKEATGGSKVCRFFNSPRGCWNGDRCRFQHEALEESEKLVCRFYRGPGTCRYGQQCYFRHSNDQEDLLVKTDPGVLDDGLHVQGESIAVEFPNMTAGSPEQKDVSLTYSQSSSDGTLYVPGNISEPSSPHTSVACSGVTSPGSEVASLCSGATSPGSSIESTFVTCVGTIATSVSEVEGTVAAVQIRQSENPGTPVLAQEETASTEMRPSVGTIATSVSEVEGTVAAVQIRQSENPGTPVLAQEETASTEMRPSGASLTHEDRPRSMLNTVAAWRRENIYITKGVEAVKEKISSKGCVCVIGVPGAGKSTALHHAALYLESKGFTVYLISGPEEFLKYYDSNNSDKKQVFVLDDALGVYSVDQGKVKLWQEHDEIVRNALGTNTKLLVSIRTQIFMYETIRDKDIVFLDKSETTDHVDYSDADYKLKLNDMRGMLTYYMRNKGTHPDNIDKVIKQVWGYTDKELTEMTEEDRQRRMSRYTAGVEFADCFPLLCGAFINTEFAKQNPEEFFTNPFPALTKVFQNIKTDNKHQFCALVLSTMFGGKLTDDLVSPLSESPLCDDKNKLDKDKEIRNYIMSTYKLKCPDDLEDLQSALNSLTGVYILHIGDTYKISHAVFHDIVTYLYNDPLFVFKYGKREFIRDRVRLNKDEQQHDPYVLVYSDDTNIERLGDRLFKDFKSDIETGAEIILQGRYTWTGARFITENHNIHDDRLISRLRSKLTDREQTDKKMIDDLFTQCMLTVWCNSDTYKHGDVPSCKLIELCLQREADCSNMYIRDLCYPLHISVQTDSLQLIQLLLQHGADKRRVDRYSGESVLHCVCHTSYNRLDLIKLLTQDGDLSVVEFITSDKQTILQILDDRDRYSILHDRYVYSREIYKNMLRDREILEALDSDSLQLEEVLSDHSIKVLTTDKHQMKDYVEHSEGKIQLVRRVHDNILTHEDRYGRSILHLSVHGYDVTEYLLQHGADKRRVDRRGDSVLHWVCKHSVCRDSKHRLDIIKLLTQDGDLSVVKFITSDRRDILQILEGDIDSVYIYNRREILKALDCGNLQLEEVLSDHSIKVLTTDKHKMKDYVEHSEGKIQLVRRVHDNILTHVDSEGRNILHYSVDDYHLTEYLLRFESLKLEINRCDRHNRSPYWYVVNDKKLDRWYTKHIVIENKEDMKKLYIKHGAVL